MLRAHIDEFGMCIRFWTNVTGIDAPRSPCWFVFRLIAKESLRVAVGDTDNAHGERGRQSKILARSADLVTSNVTAVKLPTKVGHLDFHDFSSLYDVFTSSPRYAVARSKGGPRITTVGVTCDP